MAEHDVIITKIFKSNKDFIRQRSARIIEAISFKSGTIKKPVKTIIATLPAGKMAYFLKPGKETLRVKPNLHDMFPNIGKNNKSETDGYTFEVMWEYLIKISIINQITFKKVLVLLYRLCFLIDHKEIKKGIFRYCPSKDLSDYISKINFSLQEGFADKFKTEEIGLWEYLHFIDLIGWNEDVKYHVANSIPDFKTVNQKTGRVNTILTVICAPLMISNFIQDIIQKTKNYGIINVKLITSTIQKFTKSRGICVLSNREMLEYLCPYLIE
ncbi:MAG: hypothetical protein WCZ89_02115 [Phycisphaerae bacterium]